MPTPRKSFRWLCLMRKLVSPISGIRSPFGPPSIGGAGGNGAIYLLGTEDNGFAIDFLTDSYALRRLDALDLIGAEPQGFAMDYISNTYAVRTL